MTVYKINILKLTYVYVSNIIKVIMDKKIHQHSKAVRNRMYRIKISKKCDIPMRKCSEKFEHQKGC